VSRCAKSVVDERGSALRFCGACPRSRPRALRSLCARACVFVSFVLPSLICSCSCVSVSSTTSHPLGNLIFREERTFGIATDGAEGKGRAQAGRQGRERRRSVQSGVRRCTGMARLSKGPKVWRFFACRPSRLAFAPVCPVLSAAEAAAERGGNSGSTQHTQRAMGQLVHASSLRGPARSPPPCACAAAFFRLF
jgi:hypothetical protein